MLRTGFLLGLLVGGSVSPALAALPTGFQDQPVIEGLSQPTDFAFLPDGRILFTEKVSGKVRLVVNGVLSPTAVLTLRDVNTTGYEQGLLGIAVDPGWPARPYVYLFFNRTPGNTIYISRFKGSGDLSLSSSANLSLKNRYDILVDIPDVQTDHNGGALRFGPDGMLYASVGDDCTICAVQDSSQWQGKILRFDVSALPDVGPGPPPRSLITPPDNPFPPTDPEAALVFCLGLRNPFRFQIDSQTGHLFIGDVGADEFEELNEAVGGEDFGWPFREGTFVRTWTDCSEPGGAGSQSYDRYIAGYDRTAMPSAVIVAGPSYHGVSGGAFTFPPQYDGAVFFSDYYGGFIRVVKKLGDAWYPLFLQPGQPNATDWATDMNEIVEFRVSADGALYYLNLFPGAIHRIVFTGSALGGVDTGGDLGARLRAWPNPYRAGSGWLGIERARGAKGPFQLQVVSIEGRVVRKLNSETETRARWDGKDSQGGLAPGGVYFLRVRGEKDVTRIVLLP